MINILTLVPDQKILDLIENLLTIANKSQKTFNFKAKIISNEDIPILKSSELIFNLDNKKTLHIYKKQLGLKDEDLLIIIYQGLLSTEEWTNLFCAGSIPEEEYPNLYVISLKFIDWDILKGLVTPTLQSHAIMHLILYSVVASFTPLKSHDETRGCIMDFCEELTDFNEVLIEGYKLCREECQDVLKETPYNEVINNITNGLKKDYILLDHEAIDKIQPKTAKRLSDNKIFNRFEEISRDPLKNIGSLDEILNELQSKVEEARKVNKRINDILIIIFGTIMLIGLIIILFGALKNQPLETLIGCVFEVLLIWPYTKLNKIKQENLRLKTGVSVFRLNLKSCEFEENKKGKKICIKKVVNDINKFFVGLKAMS
ncbi:MAG: hypothetical protein JSV49_09090 [Thermoplasmata archaeon]|nr:MAG: hypothetical protein JSV49_09090 [Thermoplasmata archaeon]